MLLLKFSGFQDGNAALVIFEEFLKILLALEDEYRKQYYTSFISAIKVIMLRIAWLNAIDSASVVTKIISTCILLHHNTLHTAYVITYPVRDMKFSALLASA